jgi:hypothetical protein
MRTSLDRAPSMLTADELAEREHELERTLWFKHGVVIVRLRRATGLPRMITMALEAWAKVRFEKKRTAA